MKIPLSWISLYTDIYQKLEEVGTKQLAYLYSIHTAEIDTIEEVGTEDKVVVARVLSTRPHPDSDHLNLVEIDCGAMGKKKIVCGAENIRDAKYVAVATVGVRLGAERDFEIKLSNIRGETSEGMICSTDELGLATDRAIGIMQLEKYFDEKTLAEKIGTPFFSLMVSIPGNGSESYSFPIRDTIFEIDNKFITNRPDLFSVAGNAREFGAIFSLSFTDYAGNMPKTSKKLTVEIESSNVFSYSLISIKNLSVGSSPIGIDQMLRKAGISPKYDLVDITNYIMTELGQPMHAFDADTIHGTITVRQAEDGEKVLALDGKEYTFSTKDLVIADDEKVLAIAGVIGGMSSAVSETTKNVYFESACFDPVSIRLTSQRLGVRTDSSMRYEKSLDPLLAEKALPRIFDLLKFLGKDGDFDGSFSYLDVSRVNTVTIHTDTAFVARKLGIDILKADIENILKRLGFEVTFSGESFSTKTSEKFENPRFSQTFEKGGNSCEKRVSEGVVAKATVNEETEFGTRSSHFTDVSVKVPSWRATKDISLKEDIVEEIGRIYGYEQVPNTPIKGSFPIASKNREIELRDKINAYFSANNLFETYNYSFSNEQKDAKIGYTDESGAIHIRNAFNVEYTFMRRSLVPNLLDATRENRKQFELFGLFEIGKIFERLGEDEFTERKAVAGVLVGQDMAKLREILDGCIHSILPGVDFYVEQGVENTAYLHPNRSGIYKTDGGNIITFGSVHPGVAESFGLGEESVLLFEIDYTLLMKRFMTTNYTFHEIPRFPGVRRELNFVFDERMPVAEVVAEIADIHSFLSDFRVVDIFRDKEKIGTGKKSVTFSFSIQDPTKTITDEEALIIQEAIITKLEQEGKELRK